MRNGWSAAALSFRSGPGAQHTALRVHYNLQLPQLTRREARNRLRCHSAPSGHRPPAVPSLPAALPHAPPASKAEIREQSQFWEYFFFAHSVAIGHDAFLDTREKHFVVIQKEVVSRSLSRVTFETSGQAFQGSPRILCPVLPVFSFPLFPSISNPSISEIGTRPPPPPLRLRQK